ncbi:MAG TPA: GAP family protein [Thermomicrobiales bacterium]|nr:GAP family protein [Thermomicrobiales bacterium]
MGLAVVGVVPAAIGLLLVNPVPVVAVILLLFSPRARTTAPAFVAGWIVGLLVVFGFVLVVASGDDLGNESEPTTLASIVRLLLGMALLYLAYRQWLGRPAPDDEPTVPVWMLKLEQANPLAAFGTGALLSSLSPKNLPFTISAAVSVAQAELVGGEQLIPIVVYVLLASAGIAAPMTWYFATQDHATRTLAGWRVWLAANYTTMMAIVLLMFGVILSMQGLGELVG